MIKQETESQQSVNWVENLAETVWIEIAQKINKQKQDGKQCSKQGWKLVKIQGRNKN